MAAASTTPSSEDGKPDSALANAFRYRNEIVAGCTCNGGDQFGLAPVKIEDDPTLRRGDIVAGENGLVVASRSADRRGAALTSRRRRIGLRAKYSRGAGGGAGIAKDRVLGLRLSPGRGRR